MEPKNIKIICYISVIAFLILRFFEIDPMDSLTTAVSFATLADVAYDKFLWRINLFEKTPRLYGVYEATIHSNYNNGTDYTSKITIKQTLSSITIVEEKDGDFCESVVASLCRTSQHGPWFLYYIYLTHPKPSASDDMHYGTTILSVLSRDVLEGGYYTNRNSQTAGHIRLERWHK